MCFFAVKIGAGAYSGCVYCTQEGTFSKILQKMVYPGNRHFLKMDHPLQSDAANFPLKSTSAGHMTFNQSGFSKTVL